MNIVKSNKHVFWVLWNFLKKKKKQFLRSVFFGALFSTVLAYFKNKSPLEGASGIFFYENTKSEIQRLNN